MYHLRSHWHNYDIGFTKFQTCNFSSNVTLYMKLIFCNIEKEPIKVLKIIIENDVYDVVIFKSVFKGGLCLIITII